MPDNRLLSVNKSRKPNQTQLWHYPNDGGTWKGKGTKKIIQSNQPGNEGTTADQQVIMTLTGGLHDRASKPYETRII